MQRMKVGYVSTSQLSFPGDKEAQIRRSIDELSRLSTELGYDLYAVPTQVITEEDACSAAKSIEGNNVDFLLIQCTSFSAGNLVPVLARIPGVSIGLWAIPESTQYGPVPFNSLCSVNMYASIIGNYLKHYHIPFKWFYGFSDNELFLRRFKLTVRALTAIKNLRQAKIGHIGGIAPGFNDLYYDERVLEKTYGVTINCLHEFSEIKDRALRYKTEELEGTIAEFVEGARTVWAKARPMLETNARVYRAYKDFLAVTGYDALAVSCWPKFQEELGFSVCAVVARLNDEGVVVSCEGDVPSALSMLMLKYLADDETTLMDLSDFDESDQTVLLWHCGPASNRFASEDGYSLGVNFHALPHIEGEGLNSCGITRDMVFGPHRVTIGRIAGEGQSLFLMDGQFTGKGKKSFHGSRGWLGDLRLNRVSVSVRDLINTILVQRFQHHYPVVRGDWSEAVIELANWLGLSLVQTVPYEDYLQTPV